MARKDVWDTWCEYSRPKTDLASPPPLESSKARRLALQDNGARVICRCVQGEQMSGSADIGT